MKERFIIPRGSIPIKGAYAYVISGLYVWA